VRSLKQLLQTETPAWPLVQEWFGKASNLIEVLPATRKDGEAALVAMQVTANSMLGAIALKTSGVLVDHGWLRLLGADSERMRDGLLVGSGRGAVNAPEPHDPNISLSAMMLLAACSLAVEY